MSNIKISYPELNGVNIKFDDVLINIFPEEPNDKLTGDFLNTILKIKKDDYPETEINGLMNEKEEKVKIELAKDSITVWQADKELKIKELNVKDFVDAFIDNFNKFAVEWCAPANYRAFYEKSYDELIKRMSAYTYDAEKLREKILNN